MLAHMTKTTKAADVTKTTKVVLGGRGCALSVYTLTVYISMGFVLTPFNGL